MTKKEETKAQDKPEMKMYTGTKQVKATPMTRGDYNVLRGWDVPADENPDDEGMLVEYVDGGKANHPDFDGYLSWSPQEVFDNEYRVSELPKDRLVIEQDENYQRLEKLAKVVSGKQPSWCSDLQWKLLNRQFELMTELNVIFLERLDNME
jgi:hypothetical protein